MGSLMYTPAVPNNGQTQATTTTTTRGTPPLTSVLCTMHSVLYADPEVDKLRQLKRKDRSHIVLWRRPLTTLHYFTRELLYETSKLVNG